MAIAPAWVGRRRCYNCNLGDNCTADNADNLKVFLCPVGDDVCVTYTNSKKTRLLKKSDVLIFILLFRRSKGDGMRPVELGVGLRPGSWNLRM